jgi:ADP-heptose:LPS heptosyltransferase
MERLILKCGLSPGDLVMLTAAVRDLHRCYPGRFVTDVRTPCPDLWLHNPYLTPLNDSQPAVRTIDCAYPLIDRSHLPYHCLHGFIEFLNETLDLRIRPTAYHGDIHLSPQERAWYSQVHELTGQDTPFWLLLAGGKYDVTVKWWSPERYQEIIDHFRGKLLFVQVGQNGHHHPPLRGVLDLRGCTTLRMLVRLVYHAQGVLCPITCLMHLAAAVETKPGRPALRPCVVVAGGREPVHWELYPGHQFIHSIGALPCCASGGCWKSRVRPLHDGDPRDQPASLCTNVTGALPACLDLIGSGEVIRRIETYFAGKALSYLNAAQRLEARRGVARTRHNRFDQARLTPGNARIVCERILRQLPPYPHGHAGRGIVICAGGSRLFTCAWVAIRMLRQLACSLPIEVWHLGPREMDARMASLLQPWNVRCVDALEVRKTIPCRILRGWELKCYALMHSAFAQVLFLDADNVPVRNPEYLFDTPEFEKTGAVFWPDRGQIAKTGVIWELLGLVRPAHPEFESGQMLLDKSRCWPALALAMWLNENSDFFYRYLHGDKETFHLAFRKLQIPFSFIEHPVEQLPGTMCQHDGQGRRVFQHRSGHKWNLLHNLKVDGFLFEEDCRQHLADLRRLWSGRPASIAPFRLGPWRELRPGRARAKRSLPGIRLGMISCPSRDAVREGTLARLHATDWPSPESLLLQLDTSSADDPRTRQTETTLALLQRFLQDTGDYLLLLEDDLDFNRYLWENLSGWMPLQCGKIELASLYNPGIMEEACDVEAGAYLVRAERIFGSQAMLLSRACARVIASAWHEIEGMQDIRISRLAARLKQPILYHSPSLVQHMPGPSTWGGIFHQAKDFDPAWRRQDSSPVTPAHRSISP